MKFSGYGYSNRVAIILAVSILLPCLIILCMLMRIKATDIYEKVENSVWQVINDADQNASEIASSVYQKARFITSYSELNDVLQEREKVRITPEIVVKNRTINNTMSALFSENDQLEYSVYTTNKNADFLSVVDFVEDFSEFERVPESSVGTWRVENDTDGIAQRLSFYKKYSVLSGHYNIVKISVPFENITEPFSALGYENSYVKIENTVFHYSSGRYQDAEMPAGKFHLISGQLTPFGLEAEVYVDKAIIYREFLELIFYFILGFALLVIVILFISRLISSRLMRGITDIVEGIRENNMDLIKNSHYKSRETDIIKEYLFELQQKLKDENDEKLKFESDLLTERISPHFLYNNLSAIKSSCVDGKSRQAIDRLVRYYRNVFQKGSQATTVKKEIENGVEYLQLLRFSYECDFKIDVKIDKECEELNIPSNILQPVLENAFIHGINDDETVSGIISIRAYLKDNDLYVSIVDNGGNFDKEHYEMKIADKTKKHAVSMIRARMKLYYKDDKYTVNISGNDKYTEALFRFRTAM